MLTTFFRTGFRVPANNEQASRPVTRKVVALLGPAVVTAGLVAGVCGTSALAAESTQVAFTGVERVVAFADVHGAYDDLTRLLKAIGIVDDELHWAGARTHLVSTGDILECNPFLLFIVKTSPAFAEVHHLSSAALSLVQQEEKQDKDNDKWND